MAYQYNLISFAGSYLTNTRLVGGTRIITNVSGLDAFQNDYAGKFTQSLGGTTYKFTMPREDTVIKIDAGGMLVADFIFFRNLLNAAAGAVVALTVANAAGSFSFNAFVESIEQKGDQLSNTVRDVSFTFRVATGGRI